MRSWSPERRTVPSSTSDASSSAPIARTSCGFPLSANTDVRDATRSPSTFASALISSSVMPSLRYSLSGSGLALTNGSTAMVRVVIANAPVRLRPSRGRARRRSRRRREALRRILRQRRASTRSNPDGASGRSARSGRGVSVTCFAIVARGARSPERRLAGQHLVDDAGEAVDVARHSDLGLAGRLLGAHVLGRAEREPGERERLAFGRSADVRNAEVSEQRVTVGEEDVLRLHVAVHEPVAVRVVERGADLVRDAERVVDRELASAR